MMKSYVRRSILFALLLVWNAPSRSAEIVPFHDSSWVIDGAEHRIEDHLGRESLFLKGGSAVIENADLVDGVIEFDIAFGPERGFCGAIWRVVDDNNYENFYLRPHQSGKPDACQYTPVFNRLAGWQLYHGEGFGTTIDYPFNQWIHVKIVVAGTQGEMYVGDMSTPAVVVGKFERESAAGGVGLAVSNFAPAWFSNFRFEKSHPRIAGTPPAERTAQPGTVMKWRVSAPFDEKSLEGVTALDTKPYEAMTWNTLACESWGLANLARVVVIDQGANTTFARLTVRSDSDRIAPLQIGYSDRVVAFLNGTPLYRGNNGYMTRDFRYLGTIGFFDTLLLPLKKGDNELWLAISEDFGGWGLIARFEDTNGIEW